MIIIAQTPDGFLIQAHTKEVAAILNAVTGAVPEKIPIGQKLPAIDYAATITKVKNLADDYSFKKLNESIGSVVATVEGFNKAVRDASNLE